MIGARKRPIVSHETSNLENVNMTKADLLRLVAQGKFSTCREYDPATKKERVGLADVSSEEFCLFIYGNQIEYVTDSEKYIVTVK